jgi:putative PEP-CTERM system TPR-repeat lipoprotein
LLALLLTAAPLCTLAQQAGTTDAKAARFYEDALVRYEKQDMAGAIIQLKNALKIDKNMLPVHVLLGKALLANGEMVGAEVALNEALRLGVNRAEVVVPLARAVLGQGKPEALLVDERFTTAGLPRSVQAEFLLLQASAYSDLGKPREAMKAIEDSRALAPDAAASWLGEVPVRIRARQFQEGLAAADRALALSPTSAEALYMRGSVSHAAGQLGAALADYDRAISAEPTHLESLLARAGVLIDLGRPVEAQRDLDTLRRTAPKDPRGIYLAALLAERAGDHKAARSALADVTGLLDPVPTEFMRFRPQLLMLGGLSHYGLAQHEKAKPYLEALQWQHPGSPAAKLLAQIHIGDKNVERAIEVLEQYLRSHPADSQAQILLATGHMSLGRHARAAQVLQDALKAADTPQLRAALGLSLVGGGKPTDALAQLELAYKKDPAQVRAGAALARLYLQARQPAKAAVVAEALVKREPGNADLHNLLGTVRAQAGDSARARAAFLQGVKLDAGHAPALLNLARVEASESRFDAAASHLGKVLERNDKHVEALVEMGLVAERRGQFADATRWFQKAFDNSGSTEVQPGLMLMAHHLRGSRLPAAQEVVKKLNLKAPDALSVQMANAKVALVANDLSNARLYLKRASRTAEYDAGAQVQVALMQLRSQDPAAAYYSLSKALDAHPDHVAAQALMVEAELGIGEPAKAEQRARAVVARFPKRALGHTLVGLVATARGQGPTAVDAFRRAHQLEPSTDSLLRLHRAMAAGEPVAARQLAERWLKEQPRDVAVRRALADGHARRGEMAAARVAYEAVLAVESDDVEVLNNYAHVLLALKDPGALKAAERALALRPDSPHVIGTTGWAAHHAGHTDRALQLLRDARLRDPGNDETRYYLATVLARTGRRAEARQELVAALGSGNKFASARDAAQLLQTLE